MVHGSLEGGVPIKREACVDCHRSKKVLVEIEHDRDTRKFADWTK
jgi:hypothetical protein